MLSHVINLILESRRSLSRVWRHSQDRNMAALTPESELQGMTRGTPGVKARRKAFEKDLKDRGLGYSKVKGTYEGGHENSYVIYNRQKGDDGGKLKNTASELGAKYGQKSILHKAPKDSAKLVGTTDGWMDTHGQVKKKGETDDVGHIHFNRREEDGSKPMYRTDIAGRKGRGYFDFSK